MTSCFPAGKPSARMETRSISITEPPIPASRWPPAASALSFWLDTNSSRRKLTGERPREFGYATGILNQAPYLMTQHVQTNITLL